MFTLERTEVDKEWDDFVSQSENATVFSNSRYLQGTNQKISAFYVLKGTAKKACFYAVENDEKELAQSDLVIYSGLCFSSFDKEQSWFISL